MGVAMIANWSTLFVMLIGRAKRFKAYLSQFFVDFDLFVMLTISQIPRCPDLVILVMTTTDRQNQLLYPLCMRAGNKFCSTFHCTLLHEDVYFFLFQLPFSDIQLLSSYVADMPSLSAPWSVQVVC